MSEFMPQHLPDDLDDFTQGYLTAAEWLLDEEIERDTVQGWSQEAIEQAKSDCAAFQRDNAADLARYCELYQPRGDYTVDECAGHDFWLTRNGHGSGYWDRGDDPVFNTLADAARAYSNRDAYTGDDGYLYFM